MDWDTYFLDIASVVRKKSKDPNTQIGAVIVGPEHQVLSTGFNGFPRGVDETQLDRWEKPTKYEFVEHAERNAIYNAARHGVALRGCTLYVCGFGAVPCTDCAKAVIQSGITRIIGRRVKPLSEEKIAGHAVADQMLREAGVEMVEVPA